MELHLSAVDLQGGKAGSSKCSRSDGECLTLDCVKHFLLGRRGTLVGNAAAVDDGADESTVDHKEGVSRGPPMRARHGTHQVKTLPAALGHELHVLRPREVTVVATNVVGEIYMIIWKHFKGVWVKLHFFLYIQGVIWGFGWEGSTHHFVLFNHVLEHYE